MAQVGTKRKLLGTAAEHASAEPVSLPSSNKATSNSVRLGVVKVVGRGGLAERLTSECLHKQEAHTVS